MTHEEPFQLILENAGDGVLVLNDRGIIVYVNPVAAKVLCLEKEHQGISYTVAMADSIENDAFSQYLLDAVVEKDVSHSLHGLNFSLFLLAIARASDIVSTLHSGAFVHLFTCDLLSS